MASLSPAADMLICAVSGRRRWQIFSTDRDFAGYAPILDLERLAMLV